MGEAYDNNYTADHCTVEHPKHTHSCRPPSEALSAAFIIAAWLLELAKEMTIRGGADSLGYQNCADSRDKCSTTERLDAS